MSDEPAAAPVVPPMAEAEPAGGDDALALRFEDLSVSAYDKLGNRDKPITSRLMGLSTAQLSAIAQTVGATPGDHAGLVVPNGEISAGIDGQLLEGRKTDKSKKSQLVDTLSTHPYQGITKDYLSYLTGHLQESEIKKRLSIFLDTNQILPDKTPRFERLEE
jgi:hypothetical protein